MKCQLCGRVQKKGEFFWTAPPENGRGAGRIVDADCYEKITGERPVGLQELNAQRKQKALKG